MLFQDLIPFFQPFFMPLFGHAAYEVASRIFLGVYAALCFFCSSYYPVNVGAYFILQIIFRRNSPFDKNCLMADIHPIAKGFPCKLFGCFVSFFPVDFMTFFIIILFLLLYFLHY